MTTFHTTSVEELAQRGRIRNAAPELFAALSALIPADFDDHPEDFAVEWHAARAALAKASPPPQAPIQDQGQDRSSDRRGGA